MLFCRFSELLSVSKCFCQITGPILESKGMRVIFRKRPKKSEVVKNMGKNVKNLKII